LGLLGFALFVFLNHGVAIGDRSNHEAGLHVGNVFFVLFLAFMVSLPVNLENIWKKRGVLVRSLPFWAALSVACGAYVLWFKVEHPYNADTSFLRNAFLMWVVSGPLPKTLFFIPIAAGLASVWATRWARRSFWVLLPIAVAALVPESLVEHRYGILPISLWLLLRRDASAAAEGLAAFTNAAISGVLILLISDGSWSL
jgi:hypothetical protein